jgi:hypothetical protein
VAVQVGISSLKALAAAAPHKLKHLYLSEELSPSSFGDTALAPVLSVATGAPSPTLSHPLRHLLLVLYHMPHLQRAMLCAIPPDSLLSLLCKQHNTVALLTRTARGSGLACGLVELIPNPF